jgi:hypothetical protein
MDQDVLVLQAKVMRAVLVVANPLVVPLVVVVGLGR